MNDQILDKYVDLILKAGVNLERGKNLLLTAEPIHWEFINRLEKRAYEMGARYIHSEILSPLSRKNRIDYQEAKYLDYLPSYHGHKVKAQIDEEWSYIRLEGPGDPELFKDVDQKKYSILLKTFGQATLPLIKARLSGNCPWCIAAFPTPKWAAMVMQQPESAEALEEYWKILIKILRLDRDDPIQAWHDHNAVLKRRSGLLNSMDLEYLHFVGPGTDLKVYPIPVSRWMGGAMAKRDGSHFFPNLPTEEIFCTPDYRKTVGKVRVTRPVQVLGSPVKGASFEFKDGKVIDFNATIGRETLNRFFETDPYASYLGEVALVDQDSPVLQADRIFHSILLDENATCHIALGRGIMATIDNREEMGETDLKNIGVNNSIVHVDFMIGSNQVSVMGVTRSGEKIEILRDGVIQI